MTRSTREYPTEWTWYDADEEEEEREKRRREIPLDLIHQTEDGPIRLLVEAVRDGWRASFIGEQLEGAREFDTIAEANQFVARAFRRMFPEHECDERCAAATHRGRS